MRTSLLASLAFLIAAAPATASAGLPLQYSERPLTLPEGTLGITGGLLIQDLILDTGFAVHGTVDYGVTDDFEVGALAAPIALSPEADYGNPRLNARYRLLKSAVELGAEAYAFIPVQDGSNFTLGLGLSGLLGMSSSTGLWFGGFLDINFADPDAILSLMVPLQFRINFNQNLFLFASSGLNFIDFDFDQSSMPLGGGLGYTLASPTGGPMVDLSAGVNLPLFLRFGPGDTIVTDLWTITLGATFYMAN